MKVLSLMSFLGLMMLTSATATTVINFDNLATGSGAVQLTNQYAASGVVFDQIYAAQNFIFNIVPPSSPNYASPFWTSTNPGTIFFVDPANSNVAAYTGIVTITMVGLSTPQGHPGSYSGATIDALDAGGNVIQTQTVPAISTASSNLDLTFTGQVHALRFTHTPTTVGALPFDNLSFEALTDVPEPSSMALMLGALAAIGLHRHRRTGIQRA